jgi:hypothetical protein
VEFCHPPIIKEFSSAHGVAEMDFPTVVVIHISHRCGCPTFGHNSVGFTEKRFTDDCGAKACLTRFYCRTQTRSACTNNNNIEAITLKFDIHRAA